MYLYNNFYKMLKFKVRNQIIEILEKLINFQL